ncbi:MAG TPA: hypothetical protein VMV07_18325 [Streptosporangiaceae bacterium]|nr:hypothetical protein [Streptosporangiaceae bacterium]
MKMSRRRAAIWLGLPVAALVAGGAGLTIASAASQPGTTRLDSATSHGSTPTPAPSPTRRTPTPAPSRGTPAPVPSPTPTRR